MRRSAAAGPVGLLQRGATVTIGAGIYPALELTPEDSGTADFPVVWQARASDGSTVISGGVHIPTSLFKPWTGHPGRVLTADISSFDLDFGTIVPVPFPQGMYGNCTTYSKLGLNFQNTRAMLARWPNVNSTTGRYTWQYLESQAKTTDSFSVTQPDVVARMANWSAEPDPWMHLFQKFEYVHKQIGRISKTLRRLVGLL